MTTTTRRGAAEAVGTQLLEALTQQDWIAVDGCFDGNVCFRALTPRGVREATDGVAAAGYLRRWFGDATELHLVTGIVTLRRCPVG